jgi:hypothetical protein
MADIFIHISPAESRRLWFARERSPSFLAAIWPALPADFLRGVLIGVAILELANLPFVMLLFASLFEHSFHM